MTGPIMSYTADAKLYALLAEERAKATVEGPVASLNLIEEALTQTLSVLATCARDTPETLASAERAPVIERRLELISAALRHVGYLRPVLGDAECCRPREGEPSFVLLGRDPQAPALPRPA